MARRKIHEASYTCTQGINHTTKVWYDSEWQEYMVGFFVNNIRVRGADYPTNDKQDAIDTANQHIEMIKVQMP